MRDLGFLCGDGEELRAELKEKVQMKDLKSRGHCRVAALPTFPEGTAQSSAVPWINIFILLPEHNTTSSSTWFSHIAELQSYRKAQQYFQKQFCHWVNAGSQVRRVSG